MKERFKRFMTNGRGPKSVKKAKRRSPVREDGRLATGERKPLQVGGFVTLARGAWAERLNAMRDWDGIVEGSRYFPVLDSKGKRTFGVTRILVDWGTREIANKRVRCLWYELPEDLVMAI